MTNEINSLLSYRHGNNRFLRINSRDELEVVEIPQNWGKFRMALYKFIHRRITGDQNSVKIAQKIDTLVNEDTLSQENADQLKQITSELVENFKNKKAKNILSFTPTFIGLFQQRSTPNSTAPPTPKTPTPSTSHTQSPASSLSNIDLSHVYDDEPQTPISETSSNAPTPPPSPTRRKKRKKSTTASLRKEIASLREKKARHEKYERENQAFSEFTSLLQNLEQDKFQQYIEVDGQIHTANMKIFHITLSINELRENKDSNQEEIENLELEKTTLETQVETLQGFLDEKKGVKEELTIYFELMQEMVKRAKYDEYSQKDQNSVALVEGVALSASEQHKMFIEISKYASEYEARAKSAPFTAVDNRQLDAALRKAPNA